MRRVFQQPVFSWHNHYESMGVVSALSADPSSDGVEIPAQKLFATCS
jgi:hypothetical protein